MAMFFVGDGQLDTYTFTFESTAPGWTAEIDGVTWSVPVEITQARLRLIMQPPDGVVSDEVKVWVTRQSTQQRVPVEFELAENPNAAHCYRF